MNNHLTSRQSLDNPGHIALLKRFWSGAEKITCPVCGNTRARESGWHTYCSPTCNKRARRRRAREATR